MSEPIGFYTQQDEIAALKQRVAELERELEAARKVCEGVVIAIRQGVPSEAAGLATEFLATQTREQRDEKAE